MTHPPAHASEPGTFFVLGLHNTGTSTLVAMLNSHPRILICYETWSQPPMLAKYAMDLCREEPALREIFSGRLGIVEAFARAGQILAERGCKYQWVGDKHVALSLPDLEALASSPAVYVWRPLDEWLVKREVRRAYCTDFDAKTPALHFLSCLNTASSQDRWLCLPMAEIFRDPPAFFGRVARLLGVEPSGFDLEWWKTAASPADRIKASMRWTEAHPSSLLPPQASIDVSFARAPHPFWDAADEILARLAGCSVSGGSQARRAEIEEAITRLGRDFPRLPLSLLYHSFKEWRHGQPHALGPKPGHRLSAGLRSLRALWGGVRPAPEAGAKSPVSGSEDSARQAAASASDSTSHTGEKAARLPDLSPRELLRQKTGHFSRGLGSLVRKALKLPAGVRVAEALASATVSLRSCHNHKYPRSAAEFDQIENLCWTSLFEGFAPKQPLLTSRARVVTLGSCFAVNIAERLARCGVSAFTGRVHEEANSPIAIRDLFAFLLAPHLCRYPDLWAPEIPQSRIQKFREFYAAADCAVLTVGVGIACENWLTGELVLRPNSRTAKDCVWRLVGREEAASAIGDAIQILRRSKPGIPVVVTVSPVPLFRSFLTPSSFVDDCLSKSVLRTAVQDALSASPPGVYYWPTFEMFRWVGSHTPPVFGADDGLPRHPNNALVDIAARAFARAFVSQVSESVAEGGEVELLDLVSDIPERKRAGGAPDPVLAKGETSAPGNAPNQPRAG